jgi:DNA-directed RNA polymerase specialized sigma24 family protein
MVAMVRSSLDRLSLNQRDAVERRFGLAGKPAQSYGEMGVALGITKEGARTRVQLALARIDKHFRAKGWTHDTWASAIA